MRSGAVASRHERKQAIAFVAKDSSDLSRTRDPDVAIAVVRFDAVRALKAVVDGCELSAQRGSGRLTGADLLSKCASLGCGDATARARRALLLRNAAPSADRRRQPASRRNAGDKEGAGLRSRETSCGFGGSAGWRRVFEAKLAAHAYRGTEPGLRLADDVEACSLIEALGWAGRHLQAPAAAC